VQDNGMGISDAVRDKIYEPFFTTKETSQDMGLGLAITYGIVKDYGGDIQVQSRTGEGATFILSFPAAE
jgi:histidine kinase